LKKLIFREYIWHVSQQKNLANKNRHIFGNTLIKRDIEAFEAQNSLRYVQVFSSCLAVGILSPVWRPIGQC